MTWAWVTRGGGAPYWRVCNPSWADPLDTSFSRRKGGRWNSPLSFGVLYLNATTTVAAANARRYAADHGYALADLLPGEEPQVLECTLPEQALVDIVTPAGIAAAGLPAAFPYGVDRAQCQPIGARCFGDNEAGIAGLSAAESGGPRHSIGEEAALFDRGAPLATPGRRWAFAHWYPAAG